MKSALPLLTAATAMLSLLMSSLTLALETPTVSIEHLDDHNLILYIDNHELDQSAAWKPGKTTLPLSIEQALSATLAWAGKRYPKIEGFELHEIALKHIASREHHKRWFYLVYLDALKDGKVIRKRHVFAAVLFDGKVIPAAEKPNL